MKNISGPKISNPTGYSLHDRRTSLVSDWFEKIGSGCELPARAAQELLDSGFAVMPGPVANERLEQLARAYDLAVAGAAPPDLSIGSQNTRVHDLVNCGAAFDELYVYQPVLEACCRVIGQPFKLSSLLARTVHPRAQAQPLHVDFRSDAEGWPMVGFIVMVDEFRRDNGATRFVPGSHKWHKMPLDTAADHERRDLACGAAGSVIVYNGSVWHGHTANETEEPRRSIQGAFIRRDAEPAINQGARIRPETHGRINPLAKYVLAV